MKKVGWFFLTAFLFSWVVWLPYLLPSAPEAWRMSSVPHYLGLLGPLVSAVIWTVREQGPSGLRELLHRMFIPRGGAFYGLAIPLSPFLLLLVAALIGTKGHLDQLNWSRLFHSAELKTVSPLALIALNLFVVGFGEETGWRGYALPRLQARFSALGASALLGLVWAIWHIPLFFNTRSGYHTMTAPDLVGWLISLLTGSVLLTWIFNSSRGSVLACAIFHASMDVAFIGDLGNNRVATLVGALVTLSGLLICLLLKPATLSTQQKVVVP